MNTLHALDPADRDIADAIERVRQPGKLLVEQKPGRARPRGGAESADCLQAMIEHSQLIIEQIER